VVGATLAMAWGALAGCSDEDASLVVDGTTSTRPPGSPREEFSIGDTIEIGDVQLTVHGLVDPIRPINPSTTVAPDHRWVGVDVEVRNVSDEEVDMSGIVDFALQDVANESYAVRTPDRNDGFPDLDGEIQPDESRRGTLIFEVPSRARGLSLFFAGDVLASGSVQVQLT
jgi:uncharacterized protein DUF4352